MKTGASRGAGGDGLHRHWTKSKNEHIEALEPRWLAGETLLAQVRELTAASAHARFRQPVWHLWLSPNPADRPPTKAEIDDLWARIEREFGLEGQPCAAVPHVLTRRGTHHPDWSEDTHEHRAYSLVDEDGHMVNHLRHERVRRQRICSEWEHDHRFKLTPLKHARSVLAWLDRRRPEVAVALRAAGHHETAPRRLAELPPDARARAERAAFTALDLHAIVLACWQSSASAARFEAALAKFGLRLAAGRDVAVIVDEEGVIHPLRRTLAAAARAGTGRAIAGADVDALLRGHSLAPAAAVKSELRGAFRQERAPKEREDLADESQNAAPAPGPRPWHAPAGHDRPAAVGARSPFPLVAVAREVGAHEPPLAVVDGIGAADPHGDDRLTAIGPQPPVDAADWLESLLCDQAPALRPFYEVEDGA
jgi:hypothetical protein